MRFWLSAFVVLFAIAELFDWLAQVDSWRVSGIWLALAGMGLAAASNGGTAWLWGNKEDEVDSGRLGNKAVDHKSMKDEAAERDEAEKIAPAKGIDRSDDSISFKVRPLKR